MTTTATTAAHTLKTKLHHYQIDITTESGKKKYAALVKTIRANADGRGKDHHVLYMPDKNDRTRAHGTIEDIEIETKHLFSNQSNTTDGRRVFDWYEAIVYNNGQRAQNMRFGHWMEITPEIADLRRAVQSCGYCGKQYGPDRDAPPADGFCSACLDSPYLKEGELHLLRLKPVAGESFPNREELTDAERAAMVPRYVERQTIATDSRAVARKKKQREDVEKEYAKDTASAKTEHDGKIWLLDRGFDLENVIYYTHADKFSFGWRSPVSKSVESKLLDVISEFPFAYEIKTEDGRTLEGYSE